MVVVQFVFHVRHHSSFTIDKLRRVLTMRLSCHHDAVFVLVQKFDEHIFELSKNGRRCVSDDTLFTMSASPQMNHLTLSRTLDLVPPRTSARFFSHSHYSPYVALCHAHTLIGYVTLQSLNRCSYKMRNI